MVFRSAIAVLGVIAAVWVIYDVLVNNKGLSTAAKLIWILCALFFSIITAVVYYLIGRKGSKHNVFTK